MQTVPLRTAQPLDMQLKNNLQGLVLTALSIESASIAASVTAVRSEAAVRAALACAIIGAILNSLIIALLEVRGRSAAGRRSLRLQSWCVRAGALWPVLALGCLFVGTQPTVVIAVAGGGGLLAVGGFITILWFE